MRTDPRAVEPAFSVEARLRAVPHRIDRLAAASRRVRLRLPAGRNVGLVGVGGAVGAVARVAVGVALPPVAGGWPWATMTANISGALLLGLVLGAVRDAAVVGRWVRPLVATGIIGGFTTFSTLSVETLQLGAGGRTPLAAGYAVVTAVGGLTAVWVGSAAAPAARRLRWGGR